MLVQQVHHPSPTTPPPRANYTHSSLRSAAEANERRAVAAAAAAAAHFLRLKRHEYKRVEGSSSLYLKKILVLFILKRKRKRKTIYHCSSPISSVNELFSRCKFLLLFYALLEKRKTYLVSSSSRIILLRSVEANTLSLTSR